MDGCAAVQQRSCSLFSKRLAFRRLIGISNIWHELMNSVGGQEGDLSVRPDPPFNHGALPALKWPSREPRCQRWDTAAPNTMKQWMKYGECSIFKRAGTVARLHLKPCSFGSIFFPSDTWSFQAILFRAEDTNLLPLHVCVCLLLDILNCGVFEMCLFGICRSSPQRSIRLQHNHTCPQTNISS